MMNTPDQVLLEQFLEIHDRCAEPVLGDRRQCATGLLLDSQDPIALFERRRHRLFQDHVHTGAHAVDRDVGMGKGWRADADQIDVATLAQSLMGIVHLGLFQLVFRLFCVCVFSEFVDHRDNLAALRECQIGAQVHGGNVSGSDEGDSQHEKTSCFFIRPLGKIPATLLILS
jgi:hypothetical protein